MEKVFQEIKRKIEDKNVVFFIAAGASYDCPASLPIAKTLFNEIFLMTFDNVSNKNKLLTELNYKFRFEVFFQVYIDFFGNEAIKLLDILKTGEPNHNHIFLSELVSKGYLSTIITTNFDSLIEKALEKRGIPYSLLYQGVHFKNYDPNRKAQILKLHGSLEGQNKNNTSNSVLISVNQVGKKIDKQIVNTLKKILRDKDLVFIGYSGMDDFDILPILLTTKSNRSIYWVNHKERADLVQYSAKNLEKEKPDYLKYNFGKILSNRGNGALIEGESKDFVNSLSKLLLNKSIVRKNAYYKPNYNWTYLTEWRKKMVDENKIRFLRGLILNKVGYYHEAIKHFDLIKESSNIYLNAMLQKSTSLNHSNNSEQAKLLLKDIILSKNISKELLSKCHIQLGLLEAETNNYKASRKNLAKAIKLKAIDEYDLAKLKNNIGVSYLIESDVLKNKSESIHKIKYRLYRALNNFNQSFKISKNFSDYYHNANLEDNIASTYVQLGQFDKAKSRHFKALTAFRALYQFREEASCLDSIGMFYKEQGDCLTALRFYRNALNLKKQFSTRRRVALTMHNIADLYFEVKKYRYSSDWAQKALIIFRKEELFDYVKATEDLLNRLSRA